MAKEKEAKKQADGSEKKKKRKQSVWKTYLSSQVMRQDGTPYSADESEPLSKIRVRGFLSTESIYAWEVEGAGWEIYAGGTLRRPARKFMTVAHVGPHKYTFEPMVKSAFLTAMTKTICSEIREYTELGSKWVHDGRSMDEFDEFILNRRKGDLF